MFPPASDFPNTFVSKQTWDGLEPQKWKGGRVHLKPQDQLNSIYGQDAQQVKSKRMYQAKNSDKYEYKPHIKQFQGKHGQQTFESDYRSGLKTNSGFKPSNKPDRSELRHLSQNKNGHLEDIPYGKKTYDYANQTRGQTWGLENQMNMKQRVNHLDEKRNFIDCRALGDKTFKYPEYSTDFYKEGGLVAGSSIKARPIKKTSEKSLSSTRVEGKMKWKDRVKLDERIQEQDAVDELDGWVENVLKDANPNYQDPDLFFEKMEQKEEPNAKAGGAAAKKDAKKGKK